MSAIIKLKNRVKESNSLLCVGLDSDYEKIPERFKEEMFPQHEFNKSIIDATHKFVSAFKINAAFYEAKGTEGVRNLRLTIDYIREFYPDIFTIYDAKRADIGNTNQGYVEEIFELFKFDAVTLHPYLGSEALKPFLDRKDKASIILCRTSNEGAGEFQDLISDGKPLWQIVAENVSQKWNKEENCMLVVGATYPEEMKKIREVAPNIPLLVPGIGAQGGDLQAVLNAGLDTEKGGLLISASRSIIFAEDPRMEAEKLFGEINQFRGV